jgi:Aerotolerance regulator N-terminal
MTLGAPLVLLALLLVPVLLILERLRRRPRQVVVASLALWREVPAAVRPTASRRRARNWKLLLRIAAVVLLALAGAAPALTETRASGRTLYVLVDRSPSMGVDGRLDRAMDLVEDAARPFERLRVLFTPSAAVLREGDALDAPDPAPGAEPLAAAIEGLLGMTAGDPTARALFVGDHVPDDLEDRSGLTIALVGRPLANAAVTSLRVDHDQAGPVVFVAWQGFGGKTPGLTLASKDRTLARFPGADGRRTAVHRVPADCGEVEARLDGADDAFPADDTARVVASNGRAEMGLIGEDVPVELRAALGAVLPDRLVEGAPGHGGGISFACVPPAGSTGVWILIRPGETWRGFQSGPEADAGPLAALDVRIADVVMETVFPPGLSPELTLGPAVGLRPPPDARILLRDADDRPIAAVSADGRTAVLAFDPTDSRGNFHRSGAHAVLWRVLLDVVAGGADSPAATGILDAAESDLRGEERALDPEFGPDDASTPSPVTVSLRWPFALLGLLAVLALALTAFRVRR